MISNLNKLKILTAVIKNFNLSTSKQIQGNNMKKILALSLVFAATNAKDSLEFRIIEGGRILRSSDEGREIEQRLQSQQQKNTQEIQSLEAKLKNEITSLSGKAKLLDAETLEREQEKIMKMKNEYEAKGKSMQEEFQRKFNIELGKFQKKINDEIKTLAIKNGWDVVVIKESGEIAYSSEKVDATSELITALNKNKNASKPSAQVKK